MFPRKIRISITKLLLPFLHKILELLKANTRTPAEMDMIFIPNFLIDSGKKLIIEKEKEFISLMLITGQINLLKKVSKILNLGHSELYMKTEDRYFN